MDCLVDHASYGWAGVVPGAYRDTYVLMLIILAPYLSGRPNFFRKRNADTGGHGILLGPLEGCDPTTAGIENLETLRCVPADFSGHFWTNRVELLGIVLSVQREDI